MDFFRTVFSEDPEPQRSSDSPDSLSDDQNLDDDPNPNQFSDGGWSFGDLVKTIASKSESVIGTYRRDLEELGAGLRKETEVIREAASRAVMDLPTSLDVGASVAQESLESVGQAIDDIGSSVWKSTANIIIQGRNSLLVNDIDSDSPENGGLIGSAKQIRGSGGNGSMELKRYSRFDLQLRAIQADVNSYCLEPEDLIEYENWKLGFILDEMHEEIENVIGENAVVGEIYNKVVPSKLDSINFWSRYFYRVHKLRQAEDAIAKLVKRAISGDEEEDLTWDLDDEDEESNVSVSKADSSVKTEIDLVNEVDEKVVSQLNLGNLVANNDDKVVLEGKTVNGESSKDSDVSAHLDIGWNKIEGDMVATNDEKVLAGKTVNSESGKDSDVSDIGWNKIEGGLVANNDEKVLAGKTVNGESCKDSDVSDVGWNKIEDITSSNDDKVHGVSSSANLTDLRNRLSGADDEEDLSWDIEDIDKPVKS